MSLDKGKVSDAAGTIVFAIFWTAAICGLVFGVKSCENNDYGQSKFDSVDTTKSHNYMNNTHQIVIFRDTTTKSK